MKSLFRPSYFSILLLASASTFAQQPPAPVSAPLSAPAPGAEQIRQRPRVMEQGAMQNVSGRVQQWLINPNGEADGFLLSDGTQVNFPPHLSARAMQTIKPGDTVQISGTRTAANGSVRAQRMTVNGSGREIVEQGPDANAAPPTPRDPAALVAINASGVVSRVLYTDRGDANGVILDSGAIVRFPPRALATGGMTSQLLRPGASIVARGWGTRGAQGTALEATAIGESADKMNDLFAGPGATPDRMPAVSDARGPRDAPRGGPRGGPGRVPPRPDVQPRGEGAPPMNAVPPAPVQVPPAS